MKICEKNCLLIKTDSDFVEPKYIDFSDPKSTEVISNLIGSKELTSLCLPVPIQDAILIIDLNSLENDSAYNFGILGNPIFNNVIVAKYEVINSETNEARISGFDDEESLKIKMLERLTIIFESIKKDEKELGILDKIKAMSKKDFINNLATINSIPVSEEETQEEQQTEE